MKHKPSWEALEQYGVLGLGRKVVDGLLFMTGKPCRLKSFEAECIYIYSNVEGNNHLEKKRKKTGAQ